MSSLVSRGKGCHCILLGTLWFATSAFQAAPSTQPLTRPEKPVWKWSVEDRLAKRFDREEMKARAAEQAAEKRVFQKSMPVGGADPLFSIPEDRAPSMLIEGRKTPELFLTWELFTSLLGRFFITAVTEAEPTTRR